METLNLRMDMKRQDGGANLYEAMPKEWVSCDVCGGSRFEVIANIARSHRRAGAEGHAR